MNAKTSSSYRLGDVAGYRDDPRHDIPPQSYREDLEPGELAWLMIEHPDETQPLWAEIREVLGPGWYLGRAEDGTEVEFGAEHVFGMNGRFQMGAWYDYLPGGKGKPPSPRPAAGPGPAPSPAPAAKATPWWENLPGGPRARRGGPSIFDVWKRGAPAEPVPPAGAPPPAEGPKKSFWGFFKRKPKVEIGPIPASERREHREQRETHSFRLPGIAVPTPPAPMEAQLRPQEAPRAPQQGIILPEVQSGFSVPQEALSQAPDELFQVLAPPPAAPGALIVGPPPSASEEAPEAPRAMIVEPAAALPAQMDAFSILEPHPEPYGPPAMPGTPISPFEMFQPEAQGSFGLITPGAPTPFDILEPTAAPPDQGLVVRSERGVSQSVFDILEPEPQPQSEPGAAAGPGFAGWGGFHAQEPTVFDALPPEPPKPAPKKKKAAAKKRAVDWEVPTREEWVKWIQKTFKPIENVWTHIRRERNSEYFIDEQLKEDDYGQPPLIPIETWSDSWNFDEVLPFFGVPYEVWGPIADAMDEENEQDGYSDEAWERMQTDVLYPLGSALSKAFKSIQPADLPGEFILENDDGSGTWGLCYYEKLDPKTASKRAREALISRERDTRETKELIRRRKAEVKRIWGEMPRPEDLIPWIEEKYDIERMFQDIVKVRRGKPWKAVMKEYGEAGLPLETVAEIGPNRAKEYEYEIASYFGIPPDIVRLYEDSDSSQELWDEIFWPFFRAMEDAFTMMLPSTNLPGIISVDEDDKDQLVIRYFETDEDEE